MCRTSWSELQSCFDNANSESAFSTCLEFGGFDLKGAQTSDGADTNDSDGDTINNDSDGDTINNDSAGDTITNDSAGDTINNDGDTTEDESKDQELCPTDKIFDALQNKCVCSVTCEGATPDLDEKTCTCDCD